MKTSNIVGALWIIAAALSGCEDPAQGKPSAVVASAKPTTTVSTGASSTTTLTLDASSSKFEFVGSNVTRKHEGGFKTFSATATLADGKIAGGSVQVEIDTSSLFSDSDKLTGHLKTDDFLAVDKHPKATFVSTSIVTGGKDDASHTVTGNLTLRDVTKSIEFPATIKLDGGQATVSAEFSINRKDFGLVYPGKPDDLIRDGVVIKLSLKFK